MLIKLKIALVALRGHWEAHMKVIILGYLTIVGTSYLNHLLYNFYKFLETHLFATKLAIFVKIF
jgi:hypothetical protein